MRLLAAQMENTDIVFSADNDAGQDRGLQSVLTSSAIRARASHALLARMDTGTGASSLVCSISLDPNESNWAVANVDALAKLGQRIAHQQPGADPIWEHWNAYPLGSHALCARLDAGNGEMLNAILLYDADIQEGKARALAKPVWPDLESYTRLWCWHCHDMRRIAGLTAALNLTQLATMVLDTDGALLFANRAADELLESGDGLRRHGRSVSPTDYQAALRFQVATRHVLAEQMSARAGAGRARVPILSLPRSHAERALVCAILPVGQRHLLAGDPGIVVYVLNPQADASRLIHPVCAMYGLSPVETRLVSYLASGLSLCEAAQAMRIKEHTARSYIKQIFVKTDTNRQIDLVRLVLTSIVPVFGDMTVSPA